MAFSPWPPSGGGNGVAALDSLQSTLDDVRHLILCSICDSPLYEPFTVACGHTACYTCLLKWLGHKKVCPVCRATVDTEPVPNFILRDIVHKLGSHAALLPDGETITDHDKMKSDAAKELEKDRNHAGPGVKPFHDLFCGRLRAQHDLADGVYRCPICLWELEDGACLRCDWAEDDLSDTEDEDELQSLMDEVEDEEVEHLHRAQALPDHRFAAFISSMASEALLDSGEHVHPGDEWPEEDDEYDDNDGEIGMRQVRDGISPFSPAREDAWQDASSEEDSDTSERRVRPARIVIDTDDEEEAEGQSDPEGTVSEESESDSDTQPVGESDEESEQASVQALPVLSERSINARGHGQSSGPIMLSSDTDEASSRPPQSANTRRAHLEQQRGRRNHGSNSSGHGSHPRRNPLSLNQNWPRVHSPPRLPHFDSPDNAQRRLDPDNPPRLYSQPSPPHKSEPFQSIARNNDRPSLDLAHRRNPAQHHSGNPFQHQSSNQAPRNPASRNTARRSRPHIPRGRDVSGWTRRDGPVF